jgi:uncharacterized protein (DUF433 family)
MIFLRRRNGYDDVWVVGTAFLGGALRLEDSAEVLIMNARMVIDPNISHGKPIIRGTRTPVTVVLGALAAGDSFEQIEQDFGITAEDVRACIAFACDEVNLQTYYSLSVRLA